ncbi:MAG: hypothetical protein IKU29_01770 [Parabacteroides sp.]|nr:hypothetical protein [Parabacteroides sp.]
MKKTIFWLMSLAILCSCTNSIEEVAVKTSDKLETKSERPEVMVTISFLMGQSSVAPPNAPASAQVYCSMEPEIDFDRIEFPLYNVWQWDMGWTKVYKTSTIAILSTGNYLTGLPFMAGAVTSVYKDDIQIYPESLNDQYEIDYNTVGLPLVYELPEVEDQVNIGPGNGGGGGGSDTLLRIKKPIILITE